MLKFFLVLCSLVIVKGGKSPNGEEYFSRFKPEDLLNFPADVIEDALLDVPDLIRKYGYPIETHNVETEDGYIITLHRIPHGRDGKFDEDRVPVLLMHDLASSSAVWVMNRPEGGFGYILADEGYDVWLGNCRGSYYSRKHRELDPEEHKFWSFSWHENGYYDLPAMIDYILAKRGRDKLHYVGYSQGSTSFFVMASSRPEYNDKIITMQAFAPAVYLSNLREPIVKTLVQHGEALDIFIRFFGLSELFPQTDLMFKWVVENCDSEESEYYDICMALFFTGNSEQTNRTLLPIYFGHGPAGSSSRQHVHFAQVYASGIFAQYDHGILGNVEIYGSFTPPRYYLNRVTAPVAFHYSDDDVLIEPMDVFHLEREIGNSIGLFRVPTEMFNHGHFITAIDAKKILYDRVMGIMRNYESRKDAL